MTRMKALILGTLTATMILGSSIVIAADAPAGEPQDDRSSAVASEVKKVSGGGGTGRSLPK